MTAATRIVTEADTCRELVTPKLTNARWGSAPRAIGEQRTVTFEYAARVVHRAGPRGQM
jgi:type I restriction enzyme R subunit